jgi:23S rRNA (guanosine2251-2'-O)-methyltransferase
MCRTSGSGRCCRPRLGGDGRSPEYPGAKVDALATGRCHGGVLALAGRRRLLPLDALLHGSRLRADPAFLAMFDGVEDPYHFGQAIRALYAAGATGLLVGNRDWTNAATVIARSSAGASERIPTAAVPHVPDLIARMRRTDVLVVCAHRHGDRSVYDADLTGALLLIIGGRRRGLSRPWTDAADTSVALPYARPFVASLDTTSATAAIAFEIARQRRSTTDRPLVTCPHPQ